MGGNRGKSDDCQQRKIKLVCWVESENLSKSICLYINLIKIF